MKGRSNYWNPETEKALRLSETFSRGRSKPTMTPQRETLGINNTTSLFLPPSDPLLRLCLGPTQREAQGAREPADIVHVSQPLGQKAGWVGKMDRQGK